MEIKTNYIKYAGEITAEGYKLICFPFAGGGASYYAKWNEHFTSVEIMPIQLPGRENRVKEEPIKDSTVLAGKIADEIAPYLTSENFSVFGHSMGGILGFEVVKSLEKRGLKADNCFISGTSLADLREIKMIDMTIDELDDDEVLEVVSRYGAINDDNVLMKYPELRKIYMKAIRADLALIKNYDNTREKIHCPIYALCGDKDPSETIERMHDWESYTISDVFYKEYEGDHFYLDKHLIQVSKDILSALKDKTK